MPTQTKPKMTVDDYLRSERQSDVRHEFLNGEMFAMSGASVAHGQIVTNVIASLRPQLRKTGCTIYAADLRVKVVARGLYTYPDVVAICGALQFDDAVKDTVLNPTLIIEVLSKSTRAYDRGPKFEYYRQIESFREYLLIAQDECHVEHFARQPDGRWMLSETNQLHDTIRLVALPGELRVADIYEDVLSA
jgi:Uma2 family endonuclease